MIASFKAHAADLQKQIDALFPDAVKAAERAQVQSIVAGQIRARLALDKTLDFRLESVRGILAERAALTSEIRKGIDALEFEYGFGLDEQRFEDLLRTLPREMAGESERFVYWFLGQEQGRTPCRIHGSDIELRETLRAANFFGPDDCPNLAKEEEAEVEESGPLAFPPVRPLRHYRLGGWEMRRKKFQRGKSSGRYCGSDDLRFERPMFSLFPVCGGAAWRCVEYWEGQPHGFRKFAVERCVASATSFLPSTQRSAFVSVLRKQ